MINKITIFFILLIVITLTTVIIASWMTIKRRTSPHLKNKMEIVYFFEKMFSKTIPTPISVVVWDLDCTLGDCPGWMGDVPVTQYIHNVDILVQLLAFLKNERNILNVLVSKNSMFCGSTYASSALQFSELGFDAVIKCNREEDTRWSKIRPLKNFSPNQCMLIDDQQVEVLKVVSDGGYALHVRQPFFKAIQTGEWEIYGKELNGQDSLDAESDGSFEDQNSFDNDFENVSVENDLDFSSGWDTSQTTLAVLEEYERLDDDDEDHDVDIM